MISYECREEVLHRTAGEVAWTACVHAALEEDSRVFALDLVTLGLVDLRSWWDGLLESQRHDEQNLSSGLGASRRQARQL